MPYWGANAIQGFVDVALVAEPVVLVGEDGAPFFDRARPVAFYVTNPIWPNNHIHVLKHRPGVDGRWLAYALNEVDYSLYITGSTRDKLTQAALMSIALAVPTPDEQAAIADYLDRQTAKIDTLVAKQRQLIETLRERRTAVSAGVGSPEGRNSSTSRIKYLYEVMDVRASDAIVGGHELPLLSVSIHTGVQRRDSTTDALARAEDLSNYKVCDVGDIVINRMRAFQGALGIVSEAGVVSPDYLVLRARSGYDAKWLTRVLKSSWFVGEMAARIRGVGSADLGAARTPRINPSDLGDILVEVSSQQNQLATVAAIDEQIAKIDALIEKARRFIELSIERRSALISAAVTGQIDVNSTVKGHDAPLATVAPMKRPSRKPAPHRPAQIAAKGGPRMGSV